MRRLGRCSIPNSEKPFLRFSQLRLKASSPSFFDSGDHPSADSPALLELVGCCMDGVAASAGFRSAASHWHLHELAKPQMEWNS